MEKKKTIKVRAIIHYEVEVLEEWSDDEILFYYNDELGCCKSQVIEDIQKHADKTGCLCNHVKIELVKDVEDCKDIYELSEIIRNEALGTPEFLLIQKDEE